MRWIQNVLLVIAATVYGALSGGFATILVLSSITKESKGGENFGAGPIILAITAFGAALMALTGLVGSLVWVARHRSRPWSPIVWFGIVLGVAVGQAALFGSLDAFFEQAYSQTGVWLVGVLGSGVCGGGAGGVLASLATWVGRRHWGRRK